VIKPLVGQERDVNSDAVVLKPVWDSNKGLAFAQALLPAYSLIDAYHMTSCTIDETVRRLISVGASLNHVGGVDNFCWPSIQYHCVDNPDGKFKAAQLVRSCKALKDICLSYEIPLMSGKDSMYVDGYLSGPYGETRKVSALETLQFSAISVMDDITTSVTMDSKMPGDLVYILGVTRNELGGSEYYDHFGYVGLNVPNVFPGEFLGYYSALSQAIEKGLVASVHGIYRGGLGVHLAMVAMAGNLGMNVTLEHVLLDGVERNDVVLFSESAGRFIVTVDPANQYGFEKILTGAPFSCIGNVTSRTDDFTVKGIDGSPLICVPVSKLKSFWKKPFAHQI
jgi:phosphoribosylformylglycinamidine synthase